MKKSKIIGISLAIVSLLVLNITILSDDIQQNSICIKDLSSIALAYDGESGQDGGGGSTCYNSLVWVGGSNKEIKCLNGTTCSYYTGYEKRSTSSTGTCSNM